MTKSFFSEAENRLFSTFVAATNSLATLKERVRTAELKRDAAYAELNKSPGFWLWNRACSAEYERYSAHRQAKDSSRRLSLDALAFFSRWWIRELLNALLRPMFVRYRTQRADRNEQLADVYEHRFFRLLNACDCHPFAVIVDQFGMWITDDPRDLEDDASFA